MYDLIGDIHGHAAELCQLLQQLGYAPDALGTYRHPAGRQVIFVGDFIDRGPAFVRRCKWCAPWWTAARPWP